LPKLYVKRKTADKHFLLHVIEELEDLVLSAATNGFFPPEHLDTMFSTLKGKSDKGLLLFGAFYLGVWRTHLNEKSRKASELGW